MLEFRLEVLIVAIVLDVVYEMLEFKRIYPGETLIVAVVLAVVPYVVILGPRTGSRVFGCTKFRVNGIGGICP